MSNYIFPNEIEDELLKDLIQTSDVIKAAAYIDKIAKSLGVDPALIPSDPIPEEVKELAIVYACGLRCKLATGIGTRLDASGTDIYEVKRRVYAKELIALTSAMTKEIMLGSVSTSADAYSAGIELYRS